VKTLSGVSAVAKTLDERWRREVQGHGGYTVLN
jgi:hypothetical protein